MKDSLFTDEALGGVKYDRQTALDERERDRLRKSASRRGARDLLIPEVVDPDRRESCRMDLERFASTYFPVLFFLVFSDEHRRLIETLQESILSGGRVALAAPRGFGKTTIVRIAIVWAILYGHAKYVVIVCATGEEALERLDEIKGYFDDPEDVEFLHEDFPEVCAPVVALDNSPQRAAKQTVAGKHTRIKWGQKGIMFPRCPGSECAGSIIKTRGLDSAIRGLVRGALRPDLIMLDDPQTDESAKSEYQTGERKDLISGSIEGLVGPGQTLTIIGLWTIIAHDDLAHQYTSGKVPGYRSLHIRTITKWPTNMNPAKDYIQMRQDCMAEGDYEGRRAHVHFLDNQKEIEGDGVPSWPENLSEATVAKKCLTVVDYEAIENHQNHPQLLRKEISNFQRCLNFIADLGEKGWEKFNSEYQNEPPEPETQTIMTLVAQNVQAATSGYFRGIVPMDAIGVVEGRDVGRYKINWVVCAVMPGRRLFVIDYGEELVDSPQGNVHGTKEGDRLQHAIENAIRMALMELDEIRNEHPYTREDGETASVDMCLVDSRYGMNAVRLYTDGAGQEVQALMGMGTAKGQRKWFVPKDVTLSKDGNLYARKERNEWRFFGHSDAFKRSMHAGFLLNIEENGCVRIFEPEHRRDHHIFSQHITAEEEVEVNGQSRFRKVKGRSANHYLDSLCYCDASVSYIEHWTPGASLSSNQVIKEPNITPEERPKRTIRKARSLF